jgi:Icc-related predicted phosphoesterase
MTQTVSGRSFTMEDLMEDDPRRIHEVRVCGLPPEATIYYRVGGPGAWSDIHSVKTGPEPGSRTPFRFIYGGDSRGNAPVWNLVSDALEEVDADFMLFNGDLVGNGWNQRLWDIFFDVSNPLFAETVLVPAIGNHENDALNYDLLLSLPGDERNFIQRYGNVAFVIFDDNFGPETLRDEVRPRVEAMLQEVEDAEWVVLVNHQPMYSSGGHGSDRHLQEHILDLVDRYDVDLVLHGHSHFYERTVPLTGGTQDPEGTVFIVSGGLGSPLHEAGTSDYTVTSVSTHHYMVIEVDGGTMSFRAIDLDGNLLDEFSISNESEASGRAPHGDAAADR